MKKNAFSLMLICLGIIPAIRAQENALNIPERKLNTVYLEAFGQGLYYSINYDRLLMAKHRFPASVSAGVTVLPISYLSVIATPVSFNGLIGKGSHHLELGIGLTPMYLREKDVTVGHSVSDAQGNVIETVEYEAYSNNFFLYLTPRIGYRFQRPRGGFFGKLTFTPPIGLISHWGVMKHHETGEPRGFGGRTNYFREAAFFGTPVMPWAGISFGWTF